MSLQSAAQNIGDLLLTIVNLIGYPTRVETKATPSATFGFYHGLRSHHPPWCPIGYS